MRWPQVPCTSLPSPCPPCPQMLDQIVNFFLVHAAIVLPLAVVLALVVSPTARAGFKSLLRILARPLLIAAVVALAYDGTRTLAGGSGLVVTSLAEHVASFAPGALEAMKAALTAKVHPVAWEKGLAPLLRLPAWLIAGALGLLLAWLGRRRKEVAIFTN